VAGSRWRGMYLRGMPGNFLHHPKACWQAMRDPQAFFLDPRLARQLLFQPSTPEGTVAAAIQLTCPESGKALTDLCFSLQTRPLRTRRALFVSGANDGCVPPTVVYQSVEDYQALGCQADFVLLAGTPHNLMMDGRVQEAAQTLAQFAEACEK
jgi:pimeloyl-ACP methyl ester carboxylesterase